MNLPNLEGVEIPKRISAAIVGSVVVAQMPEVDSTIKACLVAGIIIAGIISQTVTDVRGKKT